MSDPAIFAYMPIDAFLDKRLTLEQLRVLGALFSFRGKNSNIVWPSRRAIAARCGMHLSNISTATSALVRLGWLSKDGKGGFSKATRYTITVPDTVADAATVADTATIAQSATRPVAQQATRMPVADAATGKEVTSEHTSRTKSVDATNGTRLPGDWTLPDEWMGWAVQNLNWTPEQCRSVAERFADVWHSKAGASARKADWSATWRTWCRRDNDQATSFAAPQRKTLTQSRSETIAGLTGATKSLETSHERDITAESSCVAS